MLNNLNPNQKKAVITENHYVRIIAGAGSGKTRVLTSRIAWLIKNRMAFPNQILAITFTNKAANEMKERVAKMMEQSGSMVWISTIHSLCERQDILTFGCSMGAMHAANLALRRPDLFDGCFAISGLYDSPEFFGDYMDDLLYNNCPVYYIENMPDDHYYIDLYNQRKLLIVVGQGAWEGPLLESTRRLDTVMCRKGIHARFEYWGLDVNHDWPWWYKMVALYVPQLLD